MIISKSDMDTNITSLKTHIGVPIIAVVKMDGYGVGIKNAVDAWYQNGIRFFAVSSSEEAFRILSFSYTDISILLMSPVYDSETLERLIQNGVILSVVSVQNATAVSLAAEKLHIYGRVHVKIDIGMGRFGIRPRQKKELCEIYQQDWLSFEGIFSHFPCAFEKKYKRTKKQLSDFKSLLAFLKYKNINPGMAHIANSCAAIRFPETRLDAVRIGSAFLGRLPIGSDLPLKRIGSLAVQVAEVKVLKKGDRIGYAQVYKARKEKKVAILSIGHRDGFGITYLHDNCSLGCLVRNIYHEIKLFFHTPSIDFGGRRLHVVGRIGNQFTLFDISGTEIKAADVLYANVDTLLANADLQRILRP